MSIEAYKAVWSESRAQGSARLIMLCIADHADKAGVAWPSEKTMAKETLVSERQVMRVIPQLIEMGELVIEERPHGRGNTAVYRITLPSLTTGKDDTMSPITDSEKGDTMSRKGDMVSRKGDTMSPPSRIIKEPTRATIAADNPEWTGLMDLLDAFTEATGIKPPAPVKRNMESLRDKWLVPLQEIEAMANSHSPELIKNSVTHMRSKGLTIASPGSIVNIARTLYLKPQGGRNFTGPSGDEIRAAAWQRVTEASRVHGRNKPLDKWGLTEQERAALAAIGGKQAICNMDDYSEGRLQKAFFKALEGVT